MQQMKKGVAVALCGHATLAAATVIFKQANNRNKIVKFSTKSGILTAELTNGKIGLELPVNAGVKEDPEYYKQLIQIISCGLSVQEVYFSKTTGKLLVRLEDSVSRADLESISPEVEKLIAVQQTKVKGIILTVKSSGEPYNFISRYFAPWVGIKEDPVTGSAHTVLAPYWANKLNRKEFRARQCSPRGGDLDIKLDADKVRILGSSVIVLSGHINL